jgi:photosystem II stability/assembly factor-like uncharacterized protein
MAIAPDPTDACKAYVATEKGAYKTTDCGAHWTVFEDDEDADPYCDVFNCCAFSRADPDTLYFGGDFSVYRASVADGDWDEITSGMSPGSSNAVAVGLPNVWVVNNCHTFHESTDRGDSWKAVWYLADRQSQRIRMTLDPEVRGGNYTFYASHFNSTGGPPSNNAEQIVKSSSSGRTWSLSYDPPQASIVVTSIVIDTASANNATIYATYTYSLPCSVIVKSTDAGESWRGKTTGIPNSKDVYCLAIKPTDNDSLYAGLKDNGVYISTDAGDNWSATGLTNASVKTLAIDPDNTNVIYAGTTSGIYKSINGGSSWTYNIGPTNNHFVDLLIHPDVTSVIYATCVDGEGNGYVYISLNAGDDWLDITEGLPDDWIVPHNVSLGLYLADLQIDPEQTDSLFLGTKEGLYYLNTNLYHGTVSSGTVNWSDWIFVPGDFTIGASATLNVAAGTKVYVAPNYDCEAGGAEDGKVELIVEGTINVNGTSGSVAEFQPGPGSSANQWRGIHLRKDSDGDFDYVNVKYGYRGLQADTCQSLHIDDCEFQDHENAGVVILEPPTGTNVSDCQFQDCGDYGIKLDGGSPEIYNNELLNCLYASTIPVPAARPSGRTLSGGNSHLGQIHPITGSTPRLLAELTVP